MNKIKDKEYYEGLHILKILSKNKYFFILKINFIYIKHKENTYELEQSLKKLNAYKIAKNIISM